MSLSINTRHERDTITLVMAGAVTLGSAVAALREGIERALAMPGVRRLLLDMQGVTVVDSAGLGELVILYTTAAQQGCSLALVRCSPLVAQTLRMTRLDGLLAPDG